VSSTIFLLAPFKVDTQNLERNEAQEPGSEKEKKEQNSLEVFIFFLSQNFPSRPWPFLRRNSPPSLHHLPIPLTHDLIDTSSTHLSCSQVDSTRESGGRWASGRLAGEGRRGKRLCLPGTRAREGVRENQTSRCMGDSQLSGFPNKRKLSEAFGWDSRLFSLMVPQILVTYELSLQVE
jgi:hypothetical protein